MLAEGTVALLHVRELILILDKELAAVFAHLDGDVRHQVLKVTLRRLRVQMGEVLDVDFFKAQVRQDRLVNLQRLVVGLCVDRLKESQSEDIVLHLLLISECKHLFLAFPLTTFLLLLLAISSHHLVGWVSAQQFQDPFGHQITTGRELYQR